MERDSSSSEKIASWRIGRTSSRKEQKRKSSNRAAGEQKEAQHKVPAICYQEAGPGKFNTSIEIVME
jgi:hypothetical protein